MAKLGFQIRSSWCQGSPPEGGARAQGWFYPAGGARALASASTFPQPAVHLPEDPWHLRGLGEEEEEAAVGVGETQDQLASLERQVRCWAAWMGGSERGTVPSAASGYRPNQRVPAQRRAGPCLSQDGVLLQGLRLDLPPHEEPAVLCLLVSPAPPLPTSLGRGAFTGTTLPLLG